MHEELKYQENQSRIMIQYYKDNPEQKNKLSKSQKEYYQNNPHEREKIIKRITQAGHCSFLGKTHTEETKEKMRMAKKGKNKGNKNSQYGTCWIYSLTAKKTIKIIKSELDSYLSKGWIKGRKNKFD